jgi:arylsulfatase A-like enzyme
LGLEENTIIVFTSDNGPNPSFEHQRSGGLRGQKWSLYEGGIREPFIIKWKGKTRAGVVNDSNILCSVDLFPSLCKLAGVAAPADARFDGEDLSPALLGRTAARAKPLFWEYGRKPDGYLYPKPLGDKSPNVAIRDGQWKLLLNTDGTDAELYDIDADPKESSNVAAAHPEVVKRLSDQALAWRKSLP